MLHALHAPPMPLGRDVQVPEDVLVDLDVPSSRRSRDTSSITQPSDFIKPSEFAQRAQTAAVPLPRTSDTAVPAPEKHLFRQVPHGTVAPVTPPSSRSNEAMPSTPPFQSCPGGQTATVTPLTLAPDTTRGKFEICRDGACGAIILSSCATSHVQRAKHISRFIHVACRPC